MSAAADRFRQAVVANVLGPKGHASATDRRAAFDHANVPAAAKAILDKLVVNATRITDDEFKAALAAGLTEDQLFELVVCGAAGQATRQLEAALAVLPPKESA